MGHCYVEIENTKTNNTYGNKKIPYGTKNTENENKTSKNDEKVNKNSDYENIKNKVMKNN